NSARNLTKKIAVAGTGLALTGTAALPAVALPQSDIYRSPLKSRSEVSAPALSQLSPVQISKNILAPLALDKTDTDSGRPTPAGTRFDSRPPVIQKPRQLNYQDHGNFNITINPSAGMDERAIATMVRSE